MTTLYLAAALALFSSLGHSILCERLFLKPLRAEPGGPGAFAGFRARRLATAMFHLASLCWAGMAVSMLLLDPAAGGYRATLLIFAGLYAISGLGNFWVAGTPHPGGIFLTSAAALILFSLSG